MATITSSTSGPFDVGSTWIGGVVPANFDSFIVNYGHIVTVSGDQRRAGGFDDSYVRGKLQIINGGLLRMSGILYVDNTASYTSVFTSGSNSAGFFRMDPGSILEIRGTNAEQHRLQIQPHGYVTCEIEGTNPNPQTTLSSGISNRDNFAKVADASKFAAGDWINIYTGQVTAKDWLYYKNDEGFWIHDVDYTNNNIYPRDFVSPSSNIISTGVGALTVSDASVFRIGNKIIYGTGNSRNISTISSIDLFKNILSVSGSISGSVIGETVYLTSFSKYHASGETVLRVASTVTSDVDVGSGVIPVSNANGFSVGDLVIIPRSDPSYYNASSWDRVQDYTVSAVSTGNKTITIESPGYSNVQRTATISLANPAVISLSNHYNLPDSRIVLSTSGSLPSPLVANTPYYVVATGWTANSFSVSLTKRGTPISTLGSSQNGTHYLQHYGLNTLAKKGSIVVNMTRNTKIRPPEGTLYGSATGGPSEDQASSITAGYYASNYTRRYKFKNCEIFLGSNSNNIEYRSIGLRGQFAFSLTQNNYVSEFDGVTIRPSRRNSDNTGYLWEQHQLNLRNSISYNSGGYGFYRYGNNTGFFNNISVRNNTWGYWTGGHYEPFSQFQYNYISNNTNGMGLSQNNDTSNLTTHNYILFSTDSPIYLEYNNANLPFSKFYVDYFVNWPRAERASVTNFINSYFGNSWDVTGQGLFYADSVQLYPRGYFAQNRTNSYSSLFNSINHNFRYGNSLTFNRRALRFWDSNLMCWRVYPDRDDVEWMGFDNLIFVPANTTVYLAGSVKTAFGNTNYPYIRAQKNIDYYNGKYFTAPDVELTSSSLLNTENTGFFDSISFTSASVSNFETKTLTVAPQPYDYYLKAGIVCNGSVNNSRLGWWERDFEITMTNPHPSLENQNFVNALTTRKPIQIRSTLGTRKIKLGG